MRKNHKMRHPKQVSQFEPYISREARLRHLKIFRRARKLIKHGGLSPESLQRIKEDLRDTSRPTSWVLKFRKQVFPVEGNATTERDVTRILNWMMMNVKFVPERPSVIEPLYARQTAEDVLQTQKIPTAIIKVKGTNFQYPAWGCAAISDSLIALLKTMPGVKNIRHVRTRVRELPHTVVYFELPGSTPETRKKFVADPFFYGSIFFGGNPANPIMIKQVGQELGKRIEELKKTGNWKEYRNVREYNKNFNDYMRE